MKRIYCIFFIMFIVVSCQNNIQKIATEGTQVNPSDIDGADTDVLNEGSFTEADDHPVPDGIPIPDENPEGEEPEGEEPDIDAHFCSSHEECGADWLCQKDDGDCSGTGICKERPTACEEVYDPVCGCDNVTYSNTCTAHAAGKNVQHSGKCESQVICTENTECGRGGICRKEVGACSSEIEGVCELRPDSNDCPKLYNPVCGCDDKTYDNNCLALSYGINIQHGGECKEVEQQCTSIESCDESMFCLYDDKACGGVGVCTTYPENCPDVYDPVCGCDDLTYGNECEMWIKGVSLAYQGECEGTSDKVTLLYKLSESVVTEALIEIPFDGQMYSFDKATTITRTETGGGINQGVYIETEFSNADNDFVIKLRLRLNALGFRLPWEGVLGQEENYALVFQSGIFGQEKEIGAITGDVTLSKYDRDGETVTTAVITGGDNLVFKLY